jgi:ubiquinone/menaquinone biosynthesis C-methylase UbiE
MRQSVWVSGSFSGTTASYYARYRRGYPGQIVAAVVDRLGLGADEAVIDLGCGTGLLTVALAPRVRLVVGVDPEADMLAAARRSTAATTGSNVVWVLGSDADLPALAGLRGDGGWGAVTVGQALHFMDRPVLFGRALRVLRPGGGLVIISNGIPAWQQDSDWSRALRAAIEDWFGRPSSSTCGTADADRAQYRTELSADGFAVEEVSYEYQADVTVDDVIGGLFSALSPTDVPDQHRDAFTQRVARALAEAPTLTEAVPVTALIGIAP